MSGRLSPFQTLPWRIIDIIAAYVVVEQRQRSGCLLSNPTHGTNENPYKTLMQTCHEWRMALMPYALKLAPEAGENTHYSIEHDNVSGLENTPFASEILPASRAKPPRFHRMEPLGPNGLFKL
ncbi:hypothetical protein GGI11_000776 [Coemansia sp. RSA 2049]|nr:hypothetical protein H4217_000732 [Coemansia sp. RSA 1939]KAJ2524500.1 hypothetical protein GGI11_000776 [Coemansia sp. RSA 2049]